MSILQAPTTFLSLLGVIYLSRSISFFLFFFYPPVLLSFLTFGPLCGASRIARLRVSIYLYRFLSSERFEGSEEFA